MSRVEYADDTVVWRRSPTAKALWAVGIGAYDAAIILTPDVERQRPVFLIVAVFMTSFAWARVWRPHLAATQDGLIIRRATSAVFVPWHNIAEARVWAIYGVVISVRVGQHVTSAVPFRRPLQWLLHLDSDADDAVALIEARAFSADRNS